MCPSQSSSILTPGCSPPPIGSEGPTPTTPSQVNDFLFHEQWNLHLLCSLGAPCLSLVLFCCSSGLPWSVTDRGPMIRSPVPRRGTFPPFNYPHTLLQFERSACDNQRNKCPFPENSEI